MRGRRGRAIGLSIGSRNVAFAEININAEGRVEVENSGVADTPDESVMNGRVISPSAISRTIRDLFAASQIDGTKEVSLAISGEGTITGLQVLPSMSRAETLEALMGEVENYAALAGGEPILDFQATKEMDERAGQQTEVMFVAAPRELVNSYLPIMEAANLRFLAMETRPLAIFRAFTNLTEQNEDVSTTSDQPIMLVIVEEKAGIIIVVRNKVIQFMHNIEIGSGDIQTDRSFRRLARELSSSVSYYQNTFPTEGGVESIALFIDEPDLASIGEKVGALLDLPLVTPQAPKTEGGSDEANVAGYNLSEYAAIGAAIRSATRDGSAINILLSSRRTEMMGLRKHVTLFLLMAFSLGLLSAVARVGIERKADTIEDELISLQELQDFSEAQATTDIEVLQAGIASLKIQTKITDAAMNSIKWANCARILEEIRAIIPKTVRLNNVRWSGPNNVTFGGHALSYEDAYKFRRTLIDSPYFDSVRVRYIRSTEASGRSFEQFQIDCAVKVEKLGGGEQGETG